ncbi:MAG TPA: type VI secretion system baseplate subunit TssE [Pyrinomonadaceae bacterium]|nr:type VI secretion system baseplate subunit TssE [Pyrinomonadaceae bacterium]
MARTDNDVGITKSVLDRLIDYEPGNSREAVASRSKNLKELRETVRRDLEWLLNTRYIAGGIPPDLKELHNSVAAFGIPDFANLSTNQLDDQKRMRSDIEEAIRIFEPRLQDVVVTLQPTPSTERLMHFRIDGRLNVEPVPEPISFDTVLQLVNGQYVITEE